MSIKLNVTVHEIVFPELPSTGKNARPAKTTRNLSNRWTGFWGFRNRAGTSDLWIDRLNRNIFSSLKTVKMLDEFVFTE